eukprot:g2510.t1
MLHFLEKYEQRGQFFKEVQNADDRAKLGRVLYKFLSPAFLCGDVSEENFPTCYYTDCTFCHQSAAFGDSKAKSSRTTADVDATIRNVKKELYAEIKSIDMGTSELELCAKGPSKSRGRGGDDGDVFDGFVFLGEQPVERHNAVQRRWGWHRLLRLSVDMDILRRSDGKLATQQRRYRGTRRRKFLESRNRLSHFPEFFALLHSPSSSLHRGKSLRIGGRNFYYLGHKTDGTSKIDLYLFAETSVVETGLNSNRVSVNKVRSWFGDFSTVATRGKCAAYFELAFSRTVCWPDHRSALTATTTSDSSTKWTIDVQIEDDIRGVDGVVLSDGCGRISYEFLREIYRDCSNPGTVGDDEDNEEIDLADADDRNFPAMIQLRCRSSKGGMKGTLVADSSLKGRRIVFRRSMKKFGPGCEFRVEDPSSSSSSHQKVYLDINQFSRQSTSSLNIMVILVLREGGVPIEVLERLLKKQLNELRGILTHKNSRRFLSRICRTQHFDASAKASVPFERASQIRKIELMLNAGQALNDPFLQRMLRHLASTYVAKLKEKLGIDIPYAYQIMGAPDSTRTLKPGECCVVLKDGQVREGPCLVGRHPCYHRGDIQKFTSVCNASVMQSLGKYASSVVVFSTHGDLKRAPADKLSGGDYDGDEFFVIFYDEVVNAFQPSEPMDLSTIHSSTFTSTATQGAVPRRSHTNAANAAGAKGESDELSISDDDDWTEDISKDMINCANRYDQPSMMIVEGAEKIVKSTTENRDVDVVNDDDDDGDLWSQEFSQEVLELVSRTEERAVESATCAKGDTDTLATRVKLDRERVHDHAIGNKRDGIPPPLKTNTLEEGLIHDILELSPWANRSFSKAAKTWLRVATFFGINESCVRLTSAYYKALDARKHGGLTALEDADATTLRERRNHEEAVVKQNVFRKCEVLERLDGMINTWEKEWEEVEGGIFLPLKMDPKTCDIVDHDLCLSKGDGMDGYVVYTGDGRNELLANLCQELYSTWKARSFNICERKRNSASTLIRENLDQRDRQEYITLFNELRDKFTSSVRQIIVRLDEGGQFEGLDAFTIEERKRSVWKKAAMALYHYTYSYAVQTAKAKRRKEGNDSPLSIFDLKVSLPWRVAGAILNSIKYATGKFPIAATPTTW